MSHGIVTEVVHEGVQGGRGAAVGAGNIAGRGSAGAGSECQRSASLAAGIPEGSGECLPWVGQAALVGGPGCRAGTQDRPADVGDRFFKKVLATHRRAADAAGTEWKATICEAVAEDMKAR